MKQTIRLFLLPLLCLLLTSSCKKDKVPPLEQLPAATQEGKNTFGCLINGKAFTPQSGGLFNSSPKQCYYQYVKGSYYFHVSASNDKGANDILKVMVETQGIKLEEDKTYPLDVERGKDGGAGAHYIIARMHHNAYMTGPGMAGELTVTHLDEERQIVSGIFWFDAVNKQGEKVQVREGRFDMRYTR